MGAQLLTLAELNLSMEPRTRAVTQASRIEPVPSKKDLPRTFRRGRICRSGHRCPPGTHLSIYNPEDECWLCGVGQTRESDDTASIMAEAPGVA